MEMAELGWLFEQELMNISLGVITYTFRVDHFYCLVVD